VSDKTVLTPTVYQISADFMNAAAQFQTAVRIKSNRVIRIEKKARGDVDGVESTLELREEIDQGNEVAQGFGTKLFDRLTDRRCRPSTLPNVEKLIEEFTQRGSEEIASVLLKEDRRKHSTFEKRLFKAIETINDNPDWTLAQSDKTNRWIPIKVSYYRNKMMESLNKNCVKIDVTYLERVEAQAMILFQDYKPFMDAGEQGYVERWIKSRDIPTPRLLVKDHKDQGKDGFWPVRLVIPATNYTQCFAKMGYKIIKQTFDERGVNYMKYTIKQAKCLKLDLERIGRKEAIRMDKDLVAKLDIEAVYPSITYELVAEAVRYYTKGFSEDDTMRVEAGLDMLKFSMSNCLVNFGKDYFQYGKEKDPLKRVYQSADSIQPGWLT